MRKYTYSPLDAPTMVVEVTAFGPIQPNEAAEARVLCEIITGAPGRMAVIDTGEDEGMPGAGYLAIGRRLAPRRPAVVLETARVSWTG
jgi:hypothetical protein